MARPLRFGSRRLAPVEVAIEAFDGGWNIRDAPSELTPSESPDCLNATPLERGGVQKRLGLARLNGPNPMAGAAKVAFYWQTQQVVVVQIGSSLYTTSNFITFTLVATFTTSARCGMCDFSARLVVAHPVDGVFTYDGVTWTNVTVAVKGSAIAVWQNKVFVAGDLVNKPRVWWCNAGNPAVWTTSTDWVDIREHDDAPVVALGIGQGMDVSGRPGLLVYKEESTYRINNSANGSYTTLHTQAGAAGPLAICDLHGLTAVVCKRGIYVTDGVSPPKLVSQKVAPLFDPNQIDYANLTLATAGVKDNRMLFSLPRKLGGVGQASNNFTLEYHPLETWIVPHSFGVACFVQYGKSTLKLYGASPLGAYLLDVFSGWDDEGAAIASRYQTAWALPADGSRALVRHARLWGRGSFSLYTKFDYTLGQGVLDAVALLGAGFVWGSGVWGSGVWGPGEYEVTNDLYSLGVGRAVAWQVQETSAVQANGPQLLTDGTAPQVGAWALYGLHARVIPLGQT